MNRSIDAEKISRRLWTQDLKKQAQLYLGSETYQDIKKAEKSIEKLGRRGAKPITVSQFLQALSEAENIFLAEFHGVRQSQRSHLRILKKLHKLNCKFVVACEFFNINHQAAIESLVRGEISETQFLKQIEWHKNWKFPWEFYRPLVRWMIENKIVFFGVSVASNKSKSLDQCDRHVAKVLKSAKEKFSEFKLIVIFGSLHMRPGGLPDLYKASGSKTVVYQNIENLYFQLQDSGKEDQVDVVKISPSAFCLVDIPPWVLWQNFLFQMEKRGDQLLSDEVDLTDQAAKIGLLLAGATGLKLDSSRVSVTSEWQSTDFLKKIKSRDKYSQALIDDIKAGGGAYIPELDTIYISKLSVNVLSSLVMSMLIFHENKIRKWSLDSVENFEALIWLFGWSYFGSKVINPKRKSQNVSELRKSVGVKKSKEQLVLRLALAQKAFELQGGVGPSLRPKAKPDVYLAAARILGNLFGENLFKRYRRASHLNNVKLLLTRDFQAKSFRGFYYELMEDFASFQEMPSERL